MRLCKLGKTWTLMALLATTASFAEDSPKLGKPVSETDLAGFDLIVDAQGNGLPEGSGTAAEGEAVYADKCQSCHGERARGGPGVPALAGGSTSPPKFTVGSYWPHATTLFDYTRRAMPATAPKSLTDNEVYRLTAYVLYLNEIIERDFVLDKQSLPTIKMPNRNGFVDSSGVDQGTAR